MSGPEPIIKIAIRTNINFHITSLDYDSLPSLTSSLWLFTFLRRFISPMGLFSRQRILTSLGVSFHHTRRSAGENFHFVWRHWEKQQKNFICVSTRTLESTWTAHTAMTADRTYIRKRTRSERKCFDVRGPARKLAVRISSLLFLFQFTFSFWLGKFCGGKLRLALKFKRLQRKVKISGFDAKLWRKSCSQVRHLRRRQFCIWCSDFRFSGEAHEEEELSRSSVSTCVVFSLSVFSRISTLNSTSIGVSGFTLNLVVDTNTLSA